MARIAFIGLGEAGSAFITGWGPAVARQVRAYDIKTDDGATASAMWARYNALGVAGCATPAEAVGDAEIVVCTVTADRAVAAARAGAPHLRPGAFWFDLNSCAPSSKRVSAGLIEAAGGRYVAVMSPVQPKLNMVPCLISGDAATAAEPLMQALPMQVRRVEGAVGRASAIKMIRSVMVKGLEALTLECVLAAVAAGVEDEVLPSLRSGHPKLDVAARAAYNFERMMVHGERRAAEMEEVARTLVDLGLPNGMATATVDWQRAVAGAATDTPPSEDSALDAYTGRLLPRLRTTQG